jgi:endonuclease/exonuclease/phosphatase family metal-dependent hydrolase
MRNIIASFLLLITLSSIAQTRVMTYNIRNSRAADGENKWRHRKQALANVILKVNPDILGTQEVRLNQLEDLKKLLTAYAVFGAGRNNGKHAGEHSTIFYKRDKYELISSGNFWLSETPNVPGSKGWDADITRICSWVKLKDKPSGEAFFVFNTHFDHRGKEARVRSAALLHQMIDSLCGNLPVIVTGDFNFRPDNAGYAVMIAHDYRVVLKDSYSADTPNYTDCGFNVSSTKCNRIDYIFFSSHFTAHNYTLHTDNNGTYYPSDHLTISVDLKRGE